MRTATKAADRLQIMKLYSSSGEATLITLGTDLKANHIFPKISCLKVSDNVFVTSTSCFAFKPLSQDWEAFIILGCSSVRPPICLSVVAEELENPGTSFHTI